MRTKILVFIFLLSSSPAYALSTVIGWPADVATNWAALKAANHSYYQALQTLADDSLVYQDMGTYDAMLYKITGDVTYATRAYADWEEAMLGEKVDCGADFKGKYVFNLGGVDPPNTGPDCANTFNDAFRWAAIQSLVVYNWICPGDAAGAANCLNMQDLLDRFVDVATNKEKKSVGMRDADTDRTNTNYFYLMLYGQVMEEDRPGIKDSVYNYCGQINIDNSSWWCVGGLDINEAPKKSMRHRVYDYYTRNFPGGIFAEASSYNFGSERINRLATIWLEEATGVDYFPEITDEDDNWCKSGWSKINPDYDRHFGLWGIGGLTFIPDLREFTTAPYYGVMSYVCPDNEYVRKLYNDTLSLLGNNTGVHWHLLYADNTSAASKPSGQTDYFAPGRGVAIWHEGWNTNDTVIWTMLQKRTAVDAPNAYGVDHTFTGFSNVQIWKNDGYALYSPFGAHDQATGLNTLQNGLMEIFGGFGGSQEAADSYGASFGANYMHHTGGHAGCPEALDRFTPGEELVNEYNRVNFGHENSDGSTTLIFIDRVNLCGAFDDCTTTYIEEVGSTLRTQAVNRADAASYRHIWHWQTPELSTVTASGYNWTAPNGVDEVYVYPYIPGGYTTDEFDICSEYSNNKNATPYYLQGDANNSEFCNQSAYQMRTVSVTESGDLTMYAHVMHIDNAQGEPTITQISSDSESRESAYGFIIEPGSENWGLIVSSDAKTPPNPSPLKSSFLVPNHQRLQENERLRLFEKGFTSTFSTDGNLELFISGLNPNKTWKYRDNAGTINSITVSSGDALAEINLTGSGVHTLEVWSVNNTGIGTGLTLNGMTL